MKFFKITKSNTRIFNLITENFPKINTLIFNTSDKFRIYFSKLYIKSKGYLVLKLSSKILFLMVKSKEFLRNIGTPLNLKIITSLKARVKTSSNIIARLVITSSAYLRWKTSLTTIQFLRLLPTALVGKFRLLGEFDNKVLGDLDNIDLGDMDFHIT